MKRIRLLEKGLILLSVNILLLIGSYFDHGEFRFDGAVLFLITSTALYVAYWLESGKEVENDR
jgi:exosortase/archaeosortase